MLHNPTTLWFLRYTLLGSLVDLGGLKREEGIRYQAELVIIRRRLDLMVMLHAILNVIG